MIPDLVLFLCCTRYQRKQNNTNANSASKLCSVKGSSKVIHVNVMSDWNGTCTSEVLGQLSKWTTDSYFFKMVTHE